LATVFFFKRLIKISLEHILKTMDHQTIVADYQSHSGNYLTVIGVGNQVTGTYCKVIGDFNSANGYYNEVYGEEAHVTGNYCYAYGRNAFASGNNCEAHGTNARVQGSYAKCVSSSKGDAVAAAKKRDALQKNQANAPVQNQAPASSAPQPVPSFSSMFGSVGPNAVTHNHSGGSRFIVNGQDISHIINQNRGSGSINIINGRFGRIINGNNVFVDGDNEVHIGNVAAMGHGAFGVIDDRDRDDVDQNEDDPEPVADVKPLRPLKKKKTGKAPYGPEADYVRPFRLNNASVSQSPVNLPRPEVPPPLVPQAPRSFTPLVAPKEGEDPEFQEDGAADRPTCAMCLSRPPRVMFYPCGHTLCWTCGSQWPEKQVCHSCRAVVEDLKRFFVN